MAIHVNKRNIEKIKSENRDIKEVYVNGRLVWTNDNVWSCYAEGYWDNTAPWTTDTGWNNGN